MANPQAAISGTQTPLGSPPIAPSQGHGFGMGPVFLASFSTVLGAVLFLRFGYAVGHTGMLGTFAIIALGHAVTIPTALAISEIATNRRVEGGGEYFIISRSFGRTIGGAIGISLFVSQAISIAFYTAAFAESFRFMEPWFLSSFGWYDSRLVAVPATVLLAVLVLTRGASLGVRALWVVTAIQVIALAFFFLGGAPEGADIEGPVLLPGIERPDPFMLVFAVCFPAFTGMTAGVGLSGDLKNPRKSIPQGILLATISAMLIYIVLTIKLATSATPEMLATNQFVMAEISIWGPIIIIGLACATFSSALGSILVAPRTLQALGGDDFAPSARINRFVSAGTGAHNEPRNATIVAAAIAVVMVSAGSMDAIARIVSMFFMVTYGSLCAISFLEYFAARPSYRPSFRSKWYISLAGAIMCLLLMILMDVFYAALAVAFMAVLYLSIRRSHTRGGQGPDQGIAAIFQGGMAQMTRRLQIKLQGTTPTDWRPSIIMISSRTFKRTTPLRVLVWLCNRYGFGTYIHYIEGRLDRATFESGERVLARLIKEPLIHGSGVYVDTMISPSLQSALAQTLQVPGVSGVRNNTILMDFSIKDPPEVLEEVLQGCRLSSAAGLNRRVLRHGDRTFGSRRHIHIWLTWHDYRNASLLILIAYILIAHPEWESAEISIFAAYPESEVAERTRELHTMILEGRIPISPMNVNIIPTTDRSNFQQLVAERSATADLVLLGFTGARLSELGGDVFLRHKALHDILFVNAEEDILIE